MLTEQQKEAIIKREVEMQTSRSGGKGGQNVNKVETRVELSFDVEASEALEPGQKSILLKLPDLIDGRVLRVQESRERSQHANRELAAEKLLQLIDKALTPKKKRISTRPSKASKTKKLEEKKRRSELKQSRRHDF